MAITFIYPINVTGKVSLEYSTEFRKASIVKNDGLDSLNYTLRDKRGNIYKLSKEYLDKMKDYVYYENNDITFKTISASVSCSLKNAYEEWQHVRDTMNPRNGNEGNLQYCIVQNFGYDLNPELANEIGIKFAQEYLSDYQCVVSTHINTGLVHNHIEFNATSFVTGKKYNDNLKAIQDIRKISDRLCQEYGLQVLEETQEFNFIMYKTQDGKTKVYEPTRRKEASKEKFSTNDYRNSMQYEDSQKEKQSHIDILKKDIEQILPYVSSYEELLFQLHNMGYLIKDKTKAGEWRKHVSFMAPSWDRYTRDSSLGIEYTREALAAVLNKSRVKKNQEESKKDEIEMMIQKDMRVIADELNISVESMMNKKMNTIQELTNGTRREQFLLNRINGNLKALKFSEEKGITSFQQLNAVMSSLYGKHRVCREQLGIIENALREMYALLNIVKKYQSISKNNEENGHASKEMMEGVRDFLVNRGMINPSDQEQLRIKYNEYNQRFKQMSLQLKKLNSRLIDYEGFISNIKRIDKEFDLGKASYFELFNTYKKENLRSERKDNQRNGREL